MTDYKTVVKRPFFKQIVLNVVDSALVNPVAVWAAKTVLPKHLRSRIPVRGGTAQLDIGAAGSVILKNADRCEVAKEVYWADGVLPSNADQLALSLAMDCAKSAELFLDIGSYTGLFAIAAAKTNTDITSHAYEILPENYLFLWQNVFANDLVGRVEPRLTGIGTGGGTLSAPNSFGAGVLPSSVALDSEAAGGVTVPVQSLDALYSDVTGSTAWKIDVEGFELAVIEGGKDLIARTQPDIVCEILMSAPDTAAIQAIFDALDYNLFQIVDDGLRAKDALIPTREGRDWFFTPQTAQQLRDRGFAVLD